MTHCLMVMHPHTQYHWPISKDTNVMAQTRKYYLKNNYLTLRSKVPWRSLQYAIHRLMVMHPHTKYHWPILKDKNVMAQTRKYYLKNNYLTLRSNVKVSRRSLRYVTHIWSCTHIPNIIHLSGKTKKLWSGQTSLRRSKSGSVRRGDIIKSYRPSLSWLDYLPLQTKVPIS